MIFPRHYDGPPRLGRKLVLRAGLTALLVIGLSATAVAASVILEVDRVKNIFTQRGRQAIDIPEVTQAQAGGPRTILVLGSDQRYQDKKLGLKPRSDTILLVRIDPRANAISVLSIPRDLRVEIPGFGADKINAAFENGGPRLTVRTIQHLFRGATGKSFPINNVLVVDFHSFKAAVNYIGGVYVDVDRRYFNNNSSLDHYATINIQPGYQKLTGQDALDYVRYRHTDNDIVRAARQQNFLRDARDAAGFKRLLSIGNRDKLARVFSRYFQVDKSFLSTKQIFSLLKLALYLADRHPPVHQLHFPFYEAPNPAVNTFLYYRDSDLRKTVNQFMSGKGSARPSRPNRARRAIKHNTRGPVRGLEVATSEGQDQAVLAQPHLHFPFYFPTQLYHGSTYVGNEPRIYKIRDETGKKHKAYRLVVYKGLIGEYYGVQGMTWKDPPILDHPDQIRVVGGRRMMIFLDGKHVRLVAWRTHKAVYWVSNTLTESLGRAQMLGIAGSLRKLKG